MTVHLETSAPEATADKVGGDGGRSGTGTRSTTSSRRRRRRKRSRGVPLLIAPTAILLGVVIGYPVVSAIVMSFRGDPTMDTSLGRFVDQGWAGLSNYTHWLLQRCTSSTGESISCPAGTLGSLFWSSVFVTLLFAVATVALEVLLGLWFANVMHKTVRGRALIRTSVLVAWAIPTAVSAKLWAYIFSYDGIANRLLGTDILWTGETWPARIAVITADVWKTTPFVALLILAGLQMIPRDTYEAACVDGASRWQQFRYITLPLIKPAIAVAVLFRALDALRMYDLPAIMTGGGDGATTTLSMLVVDQMRQGFNSASALSTITFGLVFLIAYLLVKALSINVVETQRAQRKA
ncbi:sugar ABC transporter permease [Gordonia sinesedis]